ncbi:MAG: orotidine-5'-phosphate decarboxylase [Spirochaetia bacterium]|nr:orotidine-5'-phosphate decarboxylase [Spirochaetia bacterium]
MNIQKNKSDFLITALDFSNYDEAIALVNILSYNISFYKVGMELFYADGKAVINELYKKNKKIFLDLKLNDIPNTLYKAVKVLSKYPISYLTLFTDIEGVQAAVKAVKETGSDLKLLNVTKLTSAGSSNENNTEILKEVLIRTEFTLKAQADGIICSGKETKAIREKFGKNFIIINPGIRPAFSDSHDQKRVVTPKDAYLSGASHIVMGRPIHQAKEPVSVVNSIFNEIYIL